LQTSLFTKPLIFVVISVLVVALIYGSFTPFIVYALPPDSRWDSSQSCDQSKTNQFGEIMENVEVTCCWREKIPGYIYLADEYCQTCVYDEGQWKCSQKELQMLEQPQTPTPFDPTAPLQGGVLEQLPDQPPLFGRNEAAQPTGGIVQPFTSTTPSLFGNVPLQDSGVFGQQPAAIAPPTLVPTPILTPEPPVPMFGSTQQAAPTPPPQFGQIAPQGQEPLTGGGVAEQPIRCPVGNVWDPNLMICVPDLPPPPRLCPDGSIPQSTGPGGIRPECPPFEAVQPSTTTPTKPPITPPTLRLCPDGSIPQPTGPGGIRPACPPFETEQPEAEEQGEEPQDEGQEEPDGEQEDSSGGAPTAGPLT
jgi:hypothetical protein